MREKHLEIAKTNIILDLDPVDTEKKIAYIERLSNNNQDIFCCI